MYIHPEPSHVSTPFVLVSSDDSSLFTVRYCDVDPHAVTLHILLSRHRPRSACERSHRVSSHCSQPSRSSCGLPVWNGFLCHRPQTRPAEGINSSAQGIPHCIYHAFTITNIYIFNLKILCYGTITPLAETLILLVVKNVKIIDRICRHQVILLLYLLLSQYFGHCTKHPWCPSLKQDTEFKFWVLKSVILKYQHSFCEWHT